MTSDNPARDREMRAEQRVDRFRNALEACRASEVDMREELRRLERVVALSPDMTVLVDLDFICTFANRTFREHMGCGTDDVVGVHLRELVGDEAFDGFFEPHFRRCFHEERCDTAEWIEEDEGENRRWLVDFAKDIDDERRVVGALATARDITAVRRVKRQLDLTRVIVDQSPVILFRREAGDEARLVFVSDNIRQFGYEPADFMEGRIRFQDIIHPDDYARLGDEIREHDQAGSDTYVQEYRILTRQGRVVWVDDKTVAEKDADGNTTHYQGIIVNITERKQAEMALKESEEKYRRIIGTTAEAFVLMDLDYRILDVNQSAVHLFGRSRDELVGRRPIDFSVGGLGGSVRSAPVCSPDLECEQFEDTFERPDGTQMPTLIQTNFLHDGQGRPMGRVAFMTDMTIPKKALALAEEVQRSLLPQGVTRIGDWDVVGRCVTSDEVGGDYFDIFELDRDTSLFATVVGDISGHGVDSALLMTTARAFLRMRMDSAEPPDQIMNQLSRHLSRDLIATSRFMTMFLLVVDPGAGVYRWVRAGHDPALLLRADGTFEELGGDGMAIGVDESFNYRMFERPIRDGDGVIVLGTDGIWESRSPDGRMYGKDRLCEVIAGHAGEKAEDMVEAVYDDLARHLQGRAPEDDITLVAVRPGG